MATSREPSPSLFRLTTHDTPPHCWPGIARGFAAARALWTRFSAGLLAILLGAWAWAMFLRRPANETGLAVFIALSIVAYIYSLIVGAVATADCLSEEKREGTLGLLFLTDLKAYHIVLGKLAATSLGTIYGMLSIFPVMGVPLLLGGVAPAEARPRRPGLCEQPVFLVGAGDVLFCGLQG